jgi:hypothetical protein
MATFVRSGITFVIDDFATLFAVANVALCSERGRLLESYARHGRGLEDVLHAWALLHESLVEDAARELRASRPGLPVVRLQAESVAWDAWQSANRADADAFARSQVEKIWDALDRTQHASFLAITHALHNLGLLQEVERLTHIKGEASGSGTNQFRLFCNLRETSLPVLREKLKGPSQSIHDGFPESFRQRRDNAPKLQICTRRILELDEFGRVHRRWEATDRACDIDVDYRDPGEGHLRPSNSDVTHRDNKIDHFTRHEGVFGSGLGFSAGAGASMI